MNVRKFLASFAAGEITPELAARLDLGKFQTGLALCRNFVVLPQGPVQNRAGFEYINEVKHSGKKTRLIPFTYSDDQTLIIEAGEQYMRFHASGATVLEANQAIVSIVADLVQITAHGYSAGDWVFITNRFYVVATVPTADTFTVTNLDGTAGAPAGAVAARVYEVATPYLEADLFDIHYVQSEDVVTLVHPSYPPAELRRLGATNWQYAIISFASLADPPTGGYIITAYPTGSTTEWYDYVVTTVPDGNSNQESYASDPVLLDPVGVDITAVTNANPGVFTLSSVASLGIGTHVWIFNATGMTEINKVYLQIQSITGSTVELSADGGTTALDTTAYGVYTGGGKLSKRGAQGALSVAGALNDIGWDPVPGNPRYNVYRLLNGIYGYIGQTSLNTFRDTNIAPDTSQAPPNYPNLFNSTDNYPGAVGYFEQRRVFGGTNTLPQSVWMTRSATESNLSTSIPIRDDDAIIFKVKANAVTRVRHIIPIIDLALGCQGAVYRVIAQNSDALTPSNVSAKPNSYDGASNVQPVLTGTAALYHQARGGRLRELKYEWQAQGFTTNDISVLAPHLFDDYTLTELAYAKSPNKEIWAVRSDGALLGLTYLPEQEVVAWHQHGTDGAFESAAAIAEGIEDALYAVVNRVINSRQVRYIERKHTRRFTDVEDAFFVDAGLTYDGAPTTTISGLWHLEGETVSILADAAVHPPKVVTDGAVTLEGSFSVVHVGLPITADLQTLPFSIQLDASFAQANQKNVNKAWLRVYKSSGIKIGPSFDKLTEAKIRTDEPYGSPPRLQTGDVPVALTPTWAQTGSVCVRQSDPLPLEVLGITMEVALGG